MSFAIATAISSGVRPRPASTSNFPRAGLDPKQRVVTRNLISRLSKDKIVIISTHIVSDIETIADRILLIKQGELIDEGTVPELCEKVKTGEKNLENLYMQYYGDDT